MQTQTFWLQGLYPKPLVCGGGKAQSGKEWDPRTRVCLILLGERRMTNSQMKKPSLAKLNGLLPASK